MSALSTTHVRTNSRSRFALRLIIGAFAAATPIAIAAASAQPRMQEPPQPRQSSQVQAAAVEVSRTPYQAHLAADCIAGSNFCKFLSDRVPGSRRLEIHRVACQGWHISTTIPWFVTIAYLAKDDGLHVRRIDYLETNYRPANGGSVWALSEQTLIFIQAGHKLRIDLNSGSTGVGSYGCTITGYMVTLGMS